MTGQAWGVITVLLALLVNTASIGGRAQGVDELVALREQTSRLRNEGKYAEALPIAERYVSLARQKHGEEHAEFAAAVSLLAHIYRAQGRYAEAEPLHKRALAISEKDLGPKSPHCRH